MPLDPETGLHRPWTAAEARQATQRSHVSRQRKAISRLESAALDLELDARTPPITKAHIQARRRQLQEAASRAAGAYSPEISRLGEKIRAELRSIQLYLTVDHPCSHPKRPFLPRKVRVS